MTKEDIGKLKQAIASFGHWYDKIGRVSIIKNEEKVLILEKSIEYIEELEADIQDLEGIKLAQETALSKEYIIEEQLRKDNTELEKENSILKQKLDALDGQIPWKDIKDKSEVIGNLTKAKELLKGIVDTPMHIQMGGEMYESEEYKGLIAEAEQFLKEADK